MCLFPWRWQKCYFNVIATLMSLVTTHFWRVCTSMAPFLGSPKKIRIECCDLWTLQSVYKRWVQSFAIVVSSWHSRDAGLRLDVHIYHILSISFHVKPEARQCFLFENRIGASQGPQSCYGSRLMWRCSSGGACRAACEVNSSKGHPSSRGICKEFAGKLLANAAGARIITDSFACHHVRLETLAPKLRNFIKRRKTSRQKAEERLEKQRVKANWALGGMELLPVRRIAGVSGDLPPCSARELRHKFLCFASGRAGCMCCCTGHISLQYEGWRGQTSGGLHQGYQGKDGHREFSWQDGFRCSYTCLCVWVFVCLWWQWCMASKASEGLPLCCGSLCSRFAVELTEKSSLPGKFQGPHHHVRRQHSTRRALCQLMAWQMQISLGCVGASNVGAPQCRCGVFAGRLKTLWHSRPHRKRLFCDGVVNAKVSWAFRPSKDDDLPGACWCTPFVWRTKAMGVPMVDALDQKYRRG